MALGMVFVGLWYGSENLSEALRIRPDSVSPRQHSRRIPAKANAIHSPVFVSVANPSR